MGGSGRQELKKGSLGDRDVKQKREGNRGDGKGVCPIQSFLSITVNQGEGDPRPESDTGCCRHRTRLRSSHLTEPTAPWLLFTFLTYIYLFVWGGACYGRNVKSLFSFHHRPGIEPKSSGVVASSFIQCAILLVPVLFL